VSAIGVGEAPEPQADNIAMNIMAIMKNRFIVMLSL
jgi:hypothetical protein